MPLAATEKITAGHHERLAYSYVRQSTVRQVQQHRESQVNQYALVERARALGWAPERIRVIDADLGQSGQDGQRAGFQEVVAEVSLGHVGIVLAYEASRLARNNADWYTLLDLATVVGTLMGDADGVYDPRSYNDRLLLGLRGMFSEAELHVLRLRLAAGRARQVERGTYRQQLPTGLLRLPDGAVAKDPDQALQRTLGLVFARFHALGSCPKVLRALRDEGFLLPRRQTSGARIGDLLWKAPTEEAIYAILRNPAYAGAFVFGRHHHVPGAPGRPVRRVDRHFADWPAVHHDVYPSYITWEEFMANQERLRDNASAFARRARAAPRDGAALLGGLVVCGHCGRQMHVAYRARPAYVARAEYAARLADKQYRAVDPENRLVAAELERRWEQALRVLAEARETAERFAQRPAEPALDPALRAQLADLGTQLPSLWQGGRLQPAQQKTLLRSLIRRVPLTRPRPAQIDARIVWVSGAVTPLTLHPPAYRTTELADYAPLAARVLALSAEGHPDRVIADQLTAEGFQSARHGPVTAGLVGKIRRTQGAVSLRQQFRAREQIAGSWTLHGLAQELGVRRTWLYDRIRAGVLPATRHPVTGHYLIRDDPELLATLRAARPSS